tara:strand:+ start:1822 stop:1956 length:135 start_codon:yes stop_codon:yes gene_type:complete
LTFYLSAVEAEPEADNIVLQVLVGPEEAVAFVECQSQFLQEVTL